MGEVRKKEKEGEKERNQTPLQKKSFTNSKLKRPFLFSEVDEKPLKPDAWTTKKMPSRD